MAGGVSGRGACMVGTCVVGGVHGRGEGVCMAGGHAWQRACLAGGHACVACTPPLHRYYEMRSMSGMHSC